jgi:hypothetical protein
MLNIGFPRDADDASRSWKMVGLSFSEEATAMDIVTQQATRLPLQAAALRS